MFVPLATGRENCTPGRHHPPEKKKLTLPGATLSGAFVNAHHGKHKKVENSAGAETAAQTWGAPIGGLSGLVLPFQGVGYTLILPRRVSEHPAQFWFLKNEDHTTLTKVIVLPRSPSQKNAKKSTILER